MDTERGAARDLHGSLEYEQVSVPRECRERASVPTPGTAERGFRYALETIRLYRGLKPDPVGNILGRQFLRAGTSIGANVHEAQGGQSRADFICKMSIAHKEARESAYWLRLLCEAGIGDRGLIEKMQNETDQLIRILCAILISAKQGRK